MTIRLRRAGWLRHSQTGVGPEYWNQLHSLTFAAATLTLERSRAFLNNPTHNIGQLLVTVHILLPVLDKATLRTRTFLDPVFDEILRAGHFQPMRPCVTVRCLATSRSGGLPRRARHAAIAAAGGHLSSSTSPPSSSSSSCSCPATT